MKNKKIKNIPTVIVKEMIGTFEEKLISNKDYILKNFNRYDNAEHYVIFGVAVTTNKINKNSRVVFNPELVRKNLISMPIILDHMGFVDQIQGNIFESTIFNASDPRVKYVTIMAVIDSKNIGGKITEYNNLRFSVGYDFIRSTNKCPKCGSFAPLWINNDTKFLVCEGCMAELKNVDGTYAYGWHLRTGIKSSYSNDIDLTWENNAVNTSNAKASGDDRILSNLIKNEGYEEGTTFLQAITDTSISEVSLVLKPADASGSPLIACISIPDLIDLYSDLDSNKNTDSTTVERVFQKKTWFNDSVSDPSDHLDGQDSDDDNKNKSNLAKRNMSITATQKHELFLDKLTNVAKDHATVLDTTLTNILDMSIKDKDGAIKLLSESDGAFDLFEKSLIDSLITSLSEKNTIISSLEDEISKLNKDDDSDNGEVDPNTDKCAPKKPGKTPPKVDTNDNTPDPKNLTPEVITPPKVTITNTDGTTKSKFVVKRKLQV